MQALNWSKIVRVKWKTKGKNCLKLKENERRGSTIHIKSQTVNGPVGLYHSAPYLQMLLPRGQRTN